MKTLSSFIMFLAVLCMAHTSFAALIFSEDFEDGTADGITTLFGSYEISSGLNGSAKALRATGILGGNIFRLDGITSNNVSVEADFVIDDSSFGDFEIRVNMLSTDSTAGGEGYRAFIGPLTSDNKVMSIAKVIAGIGDNLDIVPSTVLAGQTYHLQVDRFGPNLDVYLDGTRILSATDSMFFDREINLRLFSTGTIDNIEVHAVPEPSSFVIASIMLVASAGTQGLRRIRRGQK